MIFPDPKAHKTKTRLECVFYRQSIVDFSSPKRSNCIQCQVIEVKMNLIAENGFIHKNDIHFLMVNDHIGGPLPLLCKVYVGRNMWWWNSWIKPRCFIYFWNVSEVYSLQLPDFKTLFPVCVVTEFSKSRTLWKFDVNWFAQICMYLFSGLRVILNFYSCMWRRKVHYTFQHLIHNQQAPACLNNCTKIEIPMPFMPKL